ncbi:DNAJC9 [Bugula neritina]|uniref:DNAJC9 n=1 Tax=Bugula neritina TaxID=10212 RepID=A0A7J7IYW1_BUGNE|nr:DNAJC9 [Bugula neritina]
MSYWRELFPAVSTEDVEKFHNEYKGSDEELSSLKEAYLSSKGNMQHVIDSVMCASVEDEERFKKLLEPLVKSKELPSYKKFFKEPAASKKKRHSKAVAESKEAEKLKKELKGDSSSGYADLALAMQRNREKRGDIFPI